MSIPNLPKGAFAMCCPSILILKKVAAQEIKPVSAEGQELIKHIKCCGTCFSIFKRCLDAEEDGLVTSPD